MGRSQIYSACQMTASRWLVRSNSGPTDSECVPTLDRTTSTLSVLIPADEITRLVRASRSHREKIATLLGIALNARLALEQVRSMDPPALRPQSRFVGAASSACRCLPCACPPDLTQISHSGAFCGVCTSDCETAAFDWS